MNETLTCFEIIPIPSKHTEYCKIFNSGHSGAIITSRSKKTHDKGTHLTANLIFVGFYE